MPNPIPTYNQPFNFFTPGQGITITLDTGFEDDGDNEITISANGSGTPVSMAGVFKAPTGADDVLVWLAPFACTLTAIKVWQDVGTGCHVNAFRGSLASPVLFLASDHTIAAADTVEDCGAVQNTTVAIDTKVYIRLVSVSGSPNEVGVQLNFTKN